MLDGTEETGNSLLELERINSRHFCLTIFITFDIIRYCHILASQIPVNAALNK